MPRNVYCISESSLRLATGRLSRFCFVVSLLVLAAAWTFIGFFTVFLTRETRTIVLGIFLLPALLYLLAHYLFESRAASLRLTSEFKLKSLATLLFLLLPVSIVIFRFKLQWLIDAEMVRAVATSLIFIVTVGLPLLLQAEGTLGMLVTHMKRIMWDSWGSEGDALFEETNSKTIDKKEIASIRASFYVHFESLALFQETLSCPELDSRMAVDLLPDSWLPQSITILDVGGGDGRFTYNLIVNLRTKGIAVSELRMIDPIDWKSGYVATVSKAIDKSLIHVENISLEKWRCRERFDLVIASHSLYGIADRLGRDAGELRDRVILPIMGYVNSGGHALFAMASSRGRAYRFKAEALKLLFGIDIEDADAEFLRRALLQFPTVDDCCDDIIDLTALLHRYRSGEASPLLLWLSYFLRFDMTTLNDTEQRAIIEMLEWYSSTVEELSEDLIDKYAKLSSRGVTRLSIVVPHKVTVFRVSHLSSERVRPEGALEGMPRV